jgi:hypothetical protein
LTEDAVRKYVANYEHAVVSNQAVRTGARRVDLVCSAIVDLVTDVGVYAYGACAGSWSGGGEHVDVLFPISPYFVSKRRTVRLGKESISNLERPSLPFVYGNDDDKTDIGPAKLSVYNFDTIDHNHQVQVYRIDIEDTPKIYDESWDLQAEHGIVHNRVTMDRGQYIVRITLENGHIAEENWEVTTGSDDPWSLVIYITPNGTLRIRKPQLSAGELKSNVITRTSH